MYTIHFLDAPSPWRGKGYDPVPDSDKDRKISKNNILVKIYY